MGSTPGGGPSELIHWLDMTALLLGVKSETQSYTSGLCTDRRRIYSIVRSSGKRSAACSESDGGVVHHDPCRALHRFSCILSPGSGQGCAAPVGAFFFLCFPPRSHPQFSPPPPHHRHVKLAGDRTASATRGACPGVQTESVQLKQLSILSAKSSTTSLSTRWHTSQVLVTGPPHVSLLSGRCFEAPSFMTLNGYTGNMAQSYALRQTKSASPTALPGPTSTPIAPTTSNSSKTRCGGRDNQVHQTRFSAR